MTIDKTTPLWDRSLSDEERIKWLLSAMTIDEKLTWLSSQPKDLERLGIPAFIVGGEAAHGVEGRNDQNGLGEPDKSTSFPQPIGMSASFDTELMKKAGKITGIEARVIYHRHPNRGLSRWAPTVDLERDPRWGRNEEGYGEDPVLTGAMASAYIKGIQGEDPYFVRCAATLKHFYGNNTEVGRGWKNSSMDTRNKKELYQETFRRCIVDGKVQGIMTAYNKVSGTVGLLNPEVQELLKDTYGLTHAVSDGGAMSLAVSNQHEYTLYGQAIAGALKAGVDAMSEHPDDVEKAAREAYGLGLITEKDMDRAITNMMTTKLKLGVYDREMVNPFDNVSEADIVTEESARTCLKLTEESLVLLKNDRDILPLDPSKKVAVIGPLADQWFTDWYCGTPPYTKTLMDGVKELGIDALYDDGCDRITLHFDGKNVAIDDEGRLVLTEDEAEVFIREDWGEGSATLRSVRTGKLINEVLGGPKNVENPDKAIRGTLWATKDKAFDWFVLEIVRFVPCDDGRYILQDRFHYPYCAEADGVFNIRDDQEGSCFEVRIVSDARERATKLAREAENVILALGCNSLINAKEEVDRNTLDMPELQAELLKAVAEVNDNTVVALFTNYPYSCGAQAKLVPGIIMSATGSQDMGTAMANAIFGTCSPAGRLNMTWYAKTEDLPDIDDYDIIYGGRTYRYFEGKPLYPFGYGLSYGRFEYSGFTAELDNNQLAFEMTVKNTGRMVSDEVVQIYASAPKSRAKKPVRQLITFTRIHDLAPGESRNVRVTAPVEELRFFDVVSGKLMVEEGEYLFFADYKPGSARQLLLIPGEKTGYRKCCTSTDRVAAEYYDGYSNFQITKGNIGFTALYINDACKEAEAVYNDCLLTEGVDTIFLHMKSVYGVKAEVFVNGKSAGIFEGNTRDNARYECHIMDKSWAEERKVRDLLREPNFEDIPIKLNKDLLVYDTPLTITIRMSGDVKFACFYIGNM